MSPPEQSRFFSLEGNRRELVKRVKEKTVTDHVIFSDSRDKHGKQVQESRDANDYSETEDSLQANVPEKDDDDGGGDYISDDQLAPQKTPTRTSNNSNNSSSSSSGGGSRRRSKRYLEPEVIDSIYGDIMKDPSFFESSKGNSLTNPYVLDSSASGRSSNGSAASMSKHRRTSSRSAAQQKVVQQANLVEEEEEEETIFEVEAIKGHKAYRSMVVKYEIKWVGYSEKNNTWEPASSIHEDCPELCIAYWSKHESRPLNIPTAASIARKQQQKKSKSSTPENEYLKRLEKNNITNDDLHESLRKQGFKIAYGTGFPNATTDWTLELRQIHLVQRVVGTDQILAYVSWVNRKKTVHAIQELHDHCPGELINYYEARIRFED